MVEVRKVKDFPSFTVSSKGVVKRGNYTVNTYFATANGSLMVHMNEGKKHVFKTVHNLVWETFRGPIPKGMKVVHYDGDRFNCELENLYLIEKDGIHRGNKMKDPKMQRLTRLDTEGTIYLWNAVVDRAVKDAVNGYGQQKSEAVWFLQNGVCEYLDVSPEIAYQAARTRINEYKAGKRKSTNSLPKSDIPTWKERCLKCRYKMYVSYDPSGRSNGKDVACGYLYFTGERRGCRGSECTRFEPR